MADLKRETAAQCSAALLGDILGSRTVTDRSALHRRLQDVLAHANEQLAPVTPLRITVGDEYQGVFATVGEAVHASLWLRLALLPDADLRHGIGWGETRVLQESPRVEDGSAWWVARDAIVEVEARSRRPGLREARVRYERAEGVTGPDPVAVNAALLLRDQLVGGGDDRWLRLLRGLLDGRTQADLAEAEGISPSAVSQRVRHEGIAVVLAAETMLREIA